MEEYGLRYGSINFYGADGNMQTIHFSHKLVKHHMGGNYGMTKEYVGVLANKIIKLQYYGDASAKIEVLGNAYDKKDLKKYLGNG
jgi:hypothetical protein